MRVVLDCNVLISAGLNSGICRTVLHEVLESHQCILSAQILQEYVTVAWCKRFAGAQETLISLIQVVSRNAAFVAPGPSTLHLPEDSSLTTLREGNSAAVICRRAASSAAMILASLRSDSGVCATADAESGCSGTERIDMGSKGMIVPADVKIPLRASHTDA